ncbi:hypothetical protein Tco_0534559 [Tanacetum coccineum]
MKCLVESLMSNGVLLYYKGGFTFPKRPYHEEFEGRILKLIDDQEDQIRLLEEDMRKTKDTFMCLVDSLIATLKVKIEAERVHSIKIKKITTFPTHTPTGTFEILPSLGKVHYVLMIFNINTISSYPHHIFQPQMPVLHSFEENKLEHEDEDEVEIKMMGTGMDKEFLEYNLYKNGITSIICHNFSLTSKPPVRSREKTQSHLEYIARRSKLLFGTLSLCLAVSKPSSLVEKNHCMTLGRIHMERYIENRENGRKILNSVQNGLLVWPTVVEEDGTTRTKRYE